MSATPTWRAWAASVALLFAVAPAAAQSYRVARTVVLGGDGGWDYLTYDQPTHRLFIARQDRVMVVDVDRGTLLAEIPGLNGAHGVALVPEAGRGFATSGRDSSVIVFDPASYRVVGRTAVGAGADAILYDPPSRRLLVFNGAGRSASVLDATTGAALGEIPLGAKPEFGVSAGDGRVFVNLEDTGEVAELDPVAVRLVRRWSLAACEDPTGLAIDRAHRRLFSACSNRVMAVSDAVAGRVVTRLPIGDGVDGAGFDPGTGLAFASGGDGTVTVIREESPDSFRVVETVVTRRGARTMTVDPVGHRIFTATADLGPAPAPTPERPRPRPSIVPGTFAVLVLER